MTDTPRYDHDELPIEHPRAVVMRTRVLELQLILDTWLKSSELTQIERILAMTHVLQHTVGNITWAMIKKEREEK